MLKAGLLTLFLPLVLVFMTFFLMRACNGLGFLWSPSRLPFVPTVQLGTSSKKERKKTTSFPDSFFIPSSGRSDSVFLGGHLFIKNMKTISFSDSYEKLTNLYGPFFKVCLNSVCELLGCQAKHLSALIMHESGGSTTVVNPDSSSVGLIQFMPSTCKALGVTPLLVGQLPAELQIFLVFRYFFPFRGRISEFHNLCLSCFYPAAIGKPLTWCFPVGVVSANSSMFKYGASKEAYIRYLNERFVD